MEVKLVVPFVGERFADAGALSDLIAPPYDVISEERRRVLSRRSAHNAVHLILADPDHGDDRYARVGALLEQWRRDAVLVSDESPTVTVVRQAFYVGGREHVRTGVIAAVHIEPFGEGRVKPHERTHAGPKADRLELLQATKSMFEALLMLAPDADGSLEAALAKATNKRPSAAGELDGAQVSVWVRKGREAERLAAAAGAGPLYMADGHHRYETAVSYRQSNSAASRVPALIVPVADPGLRVLPTHRIVRGSTLDFDALVDGLRERFQVRELPPTSNYLEELAALESRGTAAVVVAPSGAALAFLLKGGASLGDLPFAHAPTVASLDIARIDEIIVKRLLHLAGTDAALAYTPDPGEAIDAARTGAAAAVLVNPTPVGQVLAVADAKGVMPPKATYFVPKVPSGIVGIRYD